MFRRERVDFCFEFFGSGDGFQKKRENEFVCTKKRLGVRTREGNQKKKRKQLNAQILTQLTFVFQNNCMRWVKNIFCGDCSKIKIKLSERKETDNESTKYSIVH